MDNHGYKSVIMPTPYRLLLVDSDIKCHPKRQGGVAIISYDLLARQGHHRAQILSHHCSI